MPRHIFQRLRYDAILIAKAVLVLLLVFYLYQLYYEAGPVMLVAVLLIIGWQIKPGWFRMAQVGFDRIARHRFLSIMLTAGLALGITLGLSLLKPEPHPTVHDEFSYLLAADTFANGRLSNPTHPMWAHFESMYVIHQPTYASHYPPGQGLLLAAGQLISGRPIVGAWLSVAIACAAICWMLMAWLPARWALLGGLVAALHPLILGWGQNYWGGAIAMTGGTLMLGGFRRILRRPIARNAFLMGIGIAILAFSRPYEGAVLSLVLLTALLVWILRQRSLPRRLKIGPIILPLGAVLALTAGAWGYYNLRVTGNIFRMPVMVCGATYGVAPPFLWQQPNPEPIYRHKEMRDFYVGWGVPVYMSQRSLEGFLSASLHKVSKYANWYFQGSVVFILVIALSVLWRDRWTQFTLLVLILFTATLLMITWYEPHYAAPVTGLVFLLSLQAMRHLQVLKWRGKPIGRIATRICLILLIASLITTDLNLTRVSCEQWCLQRAQIQSDLKADGKRHLIIVRYGPDHEPHREWVYNDADIDGAQVVWAREMDEPQNRALLGYFKGRQIWLLEADEGSPVPVPYHLQ